MAGSPGEATIRWLRVELPGTLLCGNLLLVSNMLPSCSKSNSWKYRNYVVEMGTFSIIVLL